MITEQPKEAWEMVLDNSRQDISHLLPGAASNVFVVSMGAAEQAVSVALSTQAEELDRVKRELAAVREGISGLSGILALGGYIEVAEKLDALLKPE